MNTLSPASKNCSPRDLRQVLLALGAVAFTVVSWASAFPFIRIGLQGLSPLHLAAGRFGTAAVLVLAWLAWQRPRLPGWRDSLRFLLCGLFGIAFYNALLNTGEQTVAPGAASFIASTLPIFTAVLAVLFLGERINAWGWIGSLVSLAGNRRDRARPARRPGARRRQHADPRGGLLHGELFRAAATG